MASSPVTTSEHQEAQQAHPVVDFPFSHRDVRAKRPPLLGFVLRWETLRIAARIVSLVAIDVAGVFLAIFTALGVKAAVRGGFDADLVWTQTKDLVALATLVTLLLFAKSDLYADRAQRPGFARIVGSLFQVTVVALLFAVINGDGFSSYYIFYGALVFAILYISGFRYLYERATGWILRAAGYQRRAVLVGTGEHIEAVAHALEDSPQKNIDVVGFVSLKPRPDNGLRSLGALEDIGEVVEQHRIDEVIIADPDFPQREAVELVDEAHRRGVRVRIAPSTMEILVHRAEFVPGQPVPLFELKPPVFEGIDYFLKRTFDLLVSAGLLLFMSPMLLGCWAAVRMTSRGPAIYRSWRPGIGGKPFACFKFRTMYRNADLQQDAL